ncbi:uncharacterized protein LOC141641848 [Silene latifolia]|uniref:uncharacterized protein LOC141641848 n=1 Tax=Silene latifolia TaxID=37657 RepID=UPI003D76B6DD
MRLSEVYSEDIWSWALEKDGRYTVRSAYRALMNEEVDEQGPFDWTSSKWLWKGVWGSNVLPRVKKIFWQLCSEAIPTKKNIARRTRGLDVVCPVCHSEMDTCLHLVKECGWVGGIWDGLGVEIKKEVGHERVREWVEDLWRECGTDERRSIMLGCWAIWEARNKWIFDGRRVDVGDVLRRVEEIRTEVDCGVERQSGDGGSIARKGQMREDGCRGRLAEGWSLVCCDAGVKEGRVVGMRVVCRGREEDVVWAMAIHRRGMAEVEEAEAEALLEGLKEAVRRGCRRLIMASDCKTVIDILRDGKTGRSSLYLIVDEIRSFSRNVEDIIWRFVNRNCTKVTHPLAHYPGLWSGKKLWEGGLPRLDVNDGLATLLI